MGAAADTAMTPHDLEQRVAELETRVAFQEQALLELSDALAAARDDETRTALLLHRALEELKTIRSTLAASPMTGDASQEPPPPHY
jgi:SlyX protein